MTVRANSRLAGVAFLLYIGVGITSTVVRNRPHAADLLNITMSLCALILGVTLYALTRDQDRDLAMLAMLCRLLEAAPGRGEIYFAVASTLFAWLLLRGKLIPIALAWLGLASSAGLVLLLLVQTAGVFELGWSSPVTWVVWLPMLVFEVSFAVWLLVKGINTTTRPSQM